jgi:hypothetical protein
MRNVVRASFICYKQVKTGARLKYSNKAANIAPYLKHDIEQGLIEITDLKFLI